MADLKELSELLATSLAELDEVETAMSEMSEIATEMSSAIDNLNDVVYELERLTPSEPSLDLDEIRSHLEQAVEALAEAQTTLHSVRVWANTDNGRQVVYEGDLNSAVAIEFI
jgi:exonuclease VII small subunit